MSREELLSALSRRLHGLDLMVVQSTEFVGWALPASASSQFRFKVYVYQDGEPQIVAEPVSEKNGEATGAVAFWAMPFEAGYRSSKEMCAAFFKALDIILALRVSEWVKTA